MLFVALSYVYIVFELQKLLISLSFFVENYQTPSKYSHFDSLNLGEMTFLPINQAVLELA
ncbi:MAG: hypothetical protein Crog3KO_02480 [Crocinitomicaceae bacterium]